MYGSPLAREVQAKWHYMEDNPQRLLDGVSLLLTTLDKLFGSIYMVIQDITIDGSTYGWKEEMFTKLVKKSKSL